MMTTRKDKKGGNKDQATQDGGQGQGRQDGGQGPGGNDGGQGRGGNDGGQGGNDGGQGENKKDEDQYQDIEPPGFIERWSMYLLSRFEEEDHDRYQEPGAKLRKFRAEDIPRSENPRLRKRNANDDAPGQGDPKRPRRREPGARDGGLPGGEGGADDAMARNVGQPPRAGEAPAREPQPRAPPAGAPPGDGAPGAEAPGAEAAVGGEEEEEEEEEETWWDFASMAMAI